MKRSLEMALMFFAIFTPCPLSVSLFGLEVYYKCLWSILILSFVKKLLCLFFLEKTLFSAMYLYLEPNMLGVWGFGKLYLVVWCEVVFCGVVVVGSA
jgi:hypothetical protein